MGHEIVDQQARLNFADSVRRQMHVPKYNSMHAWRVRLQDGLAKLRLEHRLHTRAMQQVAGVKVLAVDLQFEQAAPVEWQLLTRLLMQLPIRLEGIALKEQGGVFSGNVRFKLVGKADDSE
jgi:hypothetical protein